MLRPSIFRSNNLWDDFFDNFATPMFTSVANTIPSVMKTDVKEVEGGYELHIDLPGFKKEDVQAELKDGYLNIKAETKSENDEKDQNGKYTRRERHVGSCTRSYYVGEHVEQEDVKASFENGVLKLFVPSVEAKKPAVEEKKLITIE